jgi:hypothetical protein
MLGSSLKYTVEVDMNYQTMQFQVREKKQQLHQEARNHRFAGQAENGQEKTNWSESTRRLVATLVSAAAILINNQ